MLVYYAAIFGAVLGATWSLKRTLNLAHLALNVAAYALVFAVIAYAYLLISSKGG